MHVPPVASEPSARERALAKACAQAVRRMERAQRDFNVFAELVGRDEHGAAIVLAPVHHAWIRHVNYCWERKMRALILAPFGHGKTSALVVPLICWLVGRDVNTRIKMVTNDDPSAGKRVNASKRIIESPVYRSVFPHANRGDKWTDHELFLKRPSYSLVDPTVHARGVFTTGIGGRCDYLFFDDVVDQKNSTDPAQRKKVLDLSEWTWMSRMEPTARFLGIGTAWHSADAYHVWMHRKGWCTLVQRINADCTAIDQEVFGAVDGQYPIG
jgi:hypothetical protein